MADVIACCDDKQYGKFLNYIYMHSNVYVKNIGTVLSKVPLYSHLEQIFSAGFDDIINSNFTKKISDIPKSLIKVAKKEK